MIHPEIKEINSVAILKHEKVVLSNGIPLYFINAGSQPLVKIDFLYAAGTSQSLNPVLPVAVNSMLNDGSENYTAEQIANLIDGKGAFFVPDIQKDFSQTSLYLLSRFSRELVPLFLDMMNNSTFPEEELKIYSDNMKQRFIVDHEKVNVQSHQAFTNAIFGDKSRYADLTKAESYATLDRSSLIDFYNTHIKNNPKQIIVSGLIDDSLRDYLIKQFETIIPSSNNEEAVFEAYKNTAPTKDWIRIEGNNNQQVSLRIGAPIVGSTHPDYWGLSLLNTLLGGYFGSRLNKVIREEKGLTYGVHSHITKLKNAHFFSIHAELNAANWEEAYEAIIDVFNGLKNEEVSAGELEMVRRYIKGSLLQSLDGAFAFSSYLRNSLVYDLDINRFNQFINYLDNVKASDLMRLSQQYLQEDKFHKIVAGV